MRKHIADFLAFLSSQRGLSENTVAAYRNDLTQFEQYTGSPRGLALRTRAHTKARPTSLAISQCDVLDYCLLHKERGTPTHRRPQDRGAQVFLPVLKERSITRATRREHRVS